MTMVQAEHGAGVGPAGAGGPMVAGLEMLRHRRVQNLLAALRACPVSADQDYAQGVLCAAVRELEETDALLEQARQKKQPRIFR